MSDWNKDKKRLRSKFLYALLEEIFQKNKFSKIY